MTITSKIVSFNVDGGVVYILTDEGKIYKKYPYSPNYELVAKSTFVETVPKIDRKKIERTKLRKFWDKATGKE